MPAEQAKRVESYVHWLLRDSRASGEWFRATAVQANEAVEAAIVAVLRGEREGRPGVGRKQINGEQTPARFAPGTLARIDSVLEPEEKRSEFIRLAVEAELKRRERKK